MSAVSSLYGTVYYWGAWGVNSLVSYAYLPKASASIDRGPISPEELYQKAQRVFQETPFLEQEIAEHLLAPYDDVSIRERVSRDIDGKFHLTVKDTKGHIRTFALSKERLAEVKGDTTKKRKLAEQITDEFLKYLNDKISDADVRKFAQSNAQQELFVSILTELNKQLPDVQGRIFSGVVDSQTNALVPVADTDLKEGQEIVFTLEDNGAVNISAVLPIQLLLPSESRDMNVAFQIEVPFSIRLTKEENGAKVKGTLTSMKTELVSCGKVVFDLASKT